MNPTELLIDTFNTLEWKQRGKTICADTRVGDIVSLTKRAAVQLAVVIAVENMSDGAYRITFGERDLPALASLGLQFPGSEQIKAASVPPR